MVWQVTLTDPAGVRPERWVAGVMDAPAAEIVLTNVWKGAARVGLRPALTEDLEDPFRHRGAPAVWEDTLACAGEGTTNVSIRLPAGSIRVTGLGEEGATLYLLSEGTNRVLRSTDDERFPRRDACVFAFLPAGRYTLVAHDCCQGSNALCRSITVREGEISEVAFPALVAGASVTGVLDADLVPLRDALAYDATASQAETGIRLHTYLSSAENGSRFVFAGLWPDTWVFSLMCDGRAIWSEQRVVQPDDRRLRLRATWSEPE